MSLIGLDIGTTGCKAIVFDARGNILVRAYREYGISSPRPHWAEQDAESVLQKALTVLSEAIGQARRDPPVALAVSAQGEAVIPVNDRGIPLRNAILGMDTRTVEENRWLAERFGKKELFLRTGMPVHTINTLPKLLWLKKNEPDIWRAADRFLLFEDFVINRLCGIAQTSHCLASRTQMYDIHKGDWDDNILSACEIDRCKLAALPADAAPVAELSADLTADTGLKRAPLVVNGGHDQACAALGTGVIDAGAAMVSTGTAEVVEVAMDRPALPDSLRTANISVYRHVVPGLYLAMTLNHSGGMLLRWFRDTLCEFEVEQARRSGGDSYDLIFAETGSGPTGLMVLPHFSGSGTPLLDTTSKGAVLGLDFSTSRADIAKAILEGLTFELRINIDLLRHAGIAVERLHAVGGGARSPLWLQLKADICGLPLRLPRVTEAACLGAALSAGMAAGVYASYRDAVEQSVAIDRDVHPEKRMSDRYAGRFELYKELYPLLIGYSRRL
jgi:xylulokinase